MGRYNYVHEGVTDEHFPVSWGPARVDAVVVHLDCEVETGDIMRELECRGYGRPPCLSCSRSVGSIPTSSASTRSLPSVRCGRILMATLTFAGFAGALTAARFASTGSAASGTDPLASWLFETSVRLLGPKGNGPRTLR